MEKQKQKLNQEQKEAIMQEMALFDEDGDGYVTVDEAHAILNQILGYSLEQTKKLFKTADKNNDGRLNKDEFIEFFFNMREKLRELKNIFNEFDRDGSGYISMDEAKKGMKEVMSLTDEEIETLVRAFDENDDGQLQYDEFVKLWNAA